MIVSLWIMSILAFIVIQLPPGDWLTHHIQQLQLTGGTGDEALAATLRKQYGLDLPLHRQYLKWVGGFVHGDFGMSFSWQKSVTEVIGERLALTVIISLSTLLLTYIAAIPIGIYSATHQYSFGDYAFTVMGFAGLAIPNFMLALIIMYFLFKYFGLSVGGLFSPEFINAPWSMARVRDLLTHIWAPLIVVGTAGTAELIRVMRAVLLDELRRQYVITARAKGLAESRLLFRYPVRIAMNPIVSTVGWQLPRIVSGATITAVVLALPTIGPLLLGALMEQDMFLAGTMVLFLGSLTLIGTFLSDLLLVIVDPRIRFE
jgi:peptide/nickel transport system permease protein